MASKKRQSVRRSRPKRSRGQKAVLHISDLIVVMWLLERVGILSSQLMNYIMNGNLELALAHIQSSIKSNFTGQGVPLTIASGAAIGMVVFILRAALKGHSISLKKPRAVAV